MGFKPNHKPEANVPAQKVEPGKYHLQIIKIEDTSGDNPTTRIVAQVRQGTNPDMINRVHVESIQWYNTQYPNLEQQSQNQICQLAVVCGLTSWDELQRRQAAEEEIQFDWSGAANAHIVAEIGTRPNKKDEKNPFHQIKTGCLWSIDDPHVEDVPKNEAAITITAAADNF